MQISEIFLCDKCFEEHGKAESAVTPQLMITWKQYKTKDAM